MKKASLLLVIAAAVLLAGWLVLGPARPGNALWTLHPSAQASDQNLRPPGQISGTQTQDSIALITALVKDAGGLIQQKGEAAFQEFKVPGSRWRKGQTYVFVLDPQGNMLVHADSTMVGKNQINLKDLKGKPIIQGLLTAATEHPNKPEGWFHYQWPVPGGLLPRWKSSYVRQVKAPSGKSYVVGSGLYDDRMERAFVVDMVKDAVMEIQQKGKGAFKAFHDPAGPFLVKNAYIFVLTMEGIELVNPAFPNLEGRNILNVKDPTGKYLTKEILKTVQTKDSGWVDYQWPKPGENVPAPKSAYVQKVMLDGKPVAVGCGVYLADAPRPTTAVRAMTAPELMALVREAATVFEKKGEDAYLEFKRKGSKWYKDNTYFIVWDLKGRRAFHAADPKLAGSNAAGARDVLGRPYGKRILEEGNSPAGEGWLHYMYPEPGDIFPAWKSVFVKRVTFPNGQPYIIGSGIYHMQMDQTLIKDLVDRAAALVASKGKEAFPALRDKTGRYVFMDTYVFVESPTGDELVNGAQPSLEGTNLWNTKDLKGNYSVRDYITAVMQKDSAWVEYYWYKPNENTQSKKLTYVRKVTHGPDTYIVGAGFYPTQDATEALNVPKGKSSKQKK
ncbi:cache domain-containing protein [Rufibacter radiotolerans]|uniref:cache domain-containing protein n=1 Tax=Rufibacter radiotolerans TaxID=1379910 RepID=UPI0006646F13|nr:cache domain-containing protein [Rufibacter radiotolerans]